MAAAIAMGAAGAWSRLGVADHGGSRNERRHQAEAARGDFAGHRALAVRTGKPSRQLRSAWTDAWAANAGATAAADAAAVVDLRARLRRVDVLAQGIRGAQALATYWVGQGVGLMNKVKPAREVVREFIEDYLAATERLSNSLPD